MRKQASKGRVMVESKSDGIESLLRVPGGSRQLSSGVNKGRESKQTKSKVKAGLARNNNNTTSNTQKQSTQNITDLRHNLSLCNEVDEALNVLGVPLNAGVAAESSDWSAQESNGPRRRVVRSSKSRSNKKNTHVQSSHNGAKRSESVLDGWGRLGFNDMLSEVRVWGEWCNVAKWKSRATLQQLWYSGNKVQAIGHENSSGGGTKHCLWMRGIHERKGSQIEIAWWCKLLFCPLPVACPIKIPCSSAFGGGKRSNGMGGWL